MLNQTECMVGVDVGGTHTRIGLVNRDGLLIDFDIVSTAALQEGGDFCSHFCSVLAEYLFRNEENRPDLVLCGISLGFPSTIDKDRRVLLSTPNIRNMDNIPIVEEVSEGIHLPVFLEKDVNMLISHDISYFHLSDDCSVIACYFGTGLGNAIYLKGDIVRGKNGVAGELGHIPVPGRQDPCGCGNEGCMENYASGRYLEKLCNRLFPGEPIRDVFARHASHPEIERFVEFLSFPVATELNIFDPDYIILGGGILQMPGFPRKKLEKALYKHARKPYPADNMKILYAPVGQENGVIGAALYGFRQLDSGRRQGRLTRLGAQEAVTKEVIPC